MHLSYPTVSPVRYILHPDLAALSYCPMGQKLIQSNGVERSTLTAATILGHVGCAAKAGQPLGKEPFGISCILLALWLHWHRHQVRAGDAKREPSTAPQGPSGSCCWNGVAGGEQPVGWRRGCQPGLGAAPGHSPSQHFAWERGPQLCHSGQGRRTQHMEYIHSAGEVLARMSLMLGRKAKHCSPPATLSPISPQACRSLLHTVRLVLPVQLHSRTTGPAQDSHGDLTCSEAQLIQPYLPAA